ncbi:hypothetical protein F511_47322 [Dorcoceras hygrometricum]|uniref:Uncharacterized protein n=1 Tax=Dorcoceras hygrometricum TaxID=472368 RepID=A0A2Z6ZXU4_9LAMI|nr:hypothetical protein F511_47322 [Dorcoceras hygrometricum]
MLREMPDAGCAMEAGRASDPRDGDADVSPLRAWWPVALIAATQSVAMWCDDGWMKRGEVLRNGGARRARCCALVGRLSRDGARAAAAFFVVATPPSPAAAPVMS